MKFGPGNFYITEGIKGKTGMKIIVDFRPTSRCISETMRDNCNVWPLWNRKQVRLILNGAIKLVHTVPWPHHPNKDV